MPNFVTKHPWVVLSSVAILLLVVAIGVHGSQHSADELTVPTRAYFSEDDGKTWFADDLQKGYQIDHGGKVAYRAVVFRRFGGSVYCGYLRRVSDEGVQQMKQLKSAGQPADQSSLERVMAEKGEVKKPGEGSWVPLASEAGVKVMTQPALPGEVAPPQLVFP